MATLGDGAPLMAANATEQHALLARFVAVLREDERIVAAWVIGSLAHGGGDAYSDLDLLVAVRDEDFAALVVDWPTFLARLAPTVSARQLGAMDKPTITAITPDWLRFDVTLTSATDPRPHGYAAALLFAHGDTPLVAFAPSAARVSPTTLPDLIDAFLRVLGLLAVAIGRGEFIAGLTPVMLLRGLLIDLYFLDNGTPRGGAKRLNTLLTDEQRRALTDLPPLVPTRESVIAGHLALARLFLPRARHLAVAHGSVYPEAFERATLAYLQRALGVRP